MGHSNGILSAPINTDDISTVLGVSSHDVTTLCCHVKNNQWAKYKPQQGGGPGILTDNERRANTYGIGKVPYFSEALKMCQWMAGMTTVNPTNFNALRGQCYTYLQPTPTNDWSRMTDYLSEDGTKGYDHNAIAPLQKFGQNEVKVYNSGTGGQFFLFRMNTNEQHIRMSDIMNLVAEAVGTTQDFSSQWYFGVGIYRDGNWGVVTQSTPLNQILLNGASAEVTHSTLKSLIGTGENTTVFPFIADVKITTFQRFTQTAYKFVPLIFASRNDVNFLAYDNASGLGYITVSFNVSGSTNIGYRAHYGLTLRNTGTGSATVKKVVINFYDRDINKEVAQNFTATLTATPISADTAIAAGSYKTLSGNIKTDYTTLYSLKCAVAFITTAGGTVVREKAEMGDILAMEPGILAPLQ